MLALSVACTAAAVVWAYLVIGHGGYWRTGQRLPTSPAPAPAASPDRWPDVVAVIPARNEAAMLPAVLPTLLGQDYPGSLTVILVDDCSTDGGCLHLRLLLRPHLRTAGRSASTRRAR